VAVSTPQPNEVSDFRSLQPGRAEPRPAGSLNSRLFAQQALDGAKREGLVLAVRARWAALAVIAVMLPIINPRSEVVYYEGLLVLFALIGWGQLKVGRVGQSRKELALLFCDLAIMTIVIVLPNPLSADDWPTAVQYRFGNFNYFFIILAAGSLGYNWRTIVAIGTWTAGLWTVGVICAHIWPNAHPELSTAVARALGSDVRLANLLDPNTIDFGRRFQEIMVFLIVAGTLAMTVRRSGQLLIRHAATERERANLARYFSPNVVQELTQHDAPLREVRTQDVAVMFVDIVGFTAYADGRDPEEVIETLRAFHGLMETHVFGHDGTLDKYLGDGLMATFGTPFTGPADASNALKCALAMLAGVDRFNRKRMADGQPTIRASIGLSFGTVVLGDIGANRLEYAVIGDTVNLASRLEAATRAVGSALLASDSLIAQVKAEGSEEIVRAAGLVARPPLAVRGMEETVAVWSMPVAPE
jgi:class 3 adenylate cyclase